MAAGTPASPSAVPSELTLRVGERKSIPLTSAGSVGYGWRLTVTGDTQTIETSTGPEHPRPPDAPPGGSLQQALFVTGLAPGRSTIRLELLRFGRPPPRESHEIVVTVVP
jgi:Chagasin family peptidase inhibitor I42